MGPVEMTAYIVLGTQVTKGEIDSGYKERIAHAIYLAKRNQGTSVLLLTGGKTRADEPTEAEAAESYFHALPTQDTNDIVVMCEDQSRTTPENILYSIDVLDQVGAQLTRVVIIGRTSQMPKVKVLVWRLWPRNRPKFEYVYVNYPMTPLWERIVDPTLMWFLSLIDPRGAWTLYLLKKLLRNG